MIAKHMWVYRGGKCEDGKIKIKIKKLSTHLSKKPNPHKTTCTGQKKSSNNFYNTPNVRKIRSQSNRIIRRPIIIRPQIVVVTRSVGHI